MPRPPSPRSGIAKGHRPGDVVSGMAWPQVVWLVLPPQPSEAQQRTIGALRSAAQAENVAVKEVRLTSVRGQHGATFLLLSRDDVAALYRGAHRQRIAIFTFGEAKVLLDISESPSNRGCVPLANFVEYKCWFSLVSRPEEVENVLPAAKTWLAETHCEGHRDPRCLPRAVFTVAGQYNLLL